MPLPALVALGVKAAPWIASGISAISGGRAAARRQRSADAAQRDVIAAARARDAQRRADRAPLAAAGARFLANPTEGAEDFADPTNPFAGAEPGRFVPITGSRFTSRRDRALSDVQDAPDRIALTREALADYDAANARGFSERLRDVGRNAARFGRLGMGENENAVRDVMTEYEGQRQRFANDLIRGATTDRVNDRFRTLGALSDADAEAIRLAQGERGYERGLARDAIGDRVANRERNINNAYRFGVAGISDGGDELDALTGASRNAREDASTARGAFGDALGNFGAMAADAIANRQGRVPLGRAPRRMPRTPVSMRTPDLSNVG